MNKKKYRAFRGRSDFQPVQEFEDRFPEYREKVWNIMDRYLEEYQHEIEYRAVEPATQCILRRWFHHQDQKEQDGRGRDSQELEDYFIKSVLGIIPREIKYERQIDLWTINLFVREYDKATAQEKPSS